LCVNENVSWLTLYIEPFQLFPPGSVSIHSNRLRKIVNIYRSALNFWAVKADIERKGSLSVNMSNLVLKARSPLFIRYSNIISTQHILYGPLFQNQALIKVNELLSVLASYCQIPDYVFVLRRSGKRRGSNTSKKVPALTQGFEWAYVPGVGLYPALEQGKRHFLPRITHTAPGCATHAN